MSQPNGFVRLTFITLVVALLLVLNPMPAAPVRAAPCLIYVGGPGASPSGDGLTWGTAVADLQVGINKANSARGGYENTCEVWVAGGTYQLAANSTFNWQDFVSIYGGFAGTESDLSQRNWRAKPSILNGNSAQVLYASFVYHSTLDGFTITGGNVTHFPYNGGGIYINCGTPNLTNLIITNNSAVNSGGGVFANNTGCTMGGAPIFTNVIFSDNGAGSAGGGLYIAGGYPTLLNVAFYGNSAPQGNGIYNDRGSTTLTNVSMSGNGIRNFGNIQPNIRNTIIWNGGEGNGIINETTGSVPNILYSLVDGCNPNGVWNTACGTDGSNNLADGEPGFVAPTNVHLLATSPVIDKGNSSFLSGYSTDLDGNPRIQGGAVDLGAYEFSGSKSDQSITFDALADKIFGDPPFAISATASSGLPVTFTTSSTACSVTGSQVSILDVGSCAITAHQAGDASYNPAPEVLRSFTIAKADQTITFADLVDRTLDEPPFTITSTATSGLPVTFSTNSAACSVEGSLVTLLSTGMCSITASQAGDDNYNAAPDVTRNFNVNPERLDQTITFLPLGDKYFGNPPFTITATASSGLPVTFSTSSLTCSLSGSTVTILAAGGCSITAHQAGNSVYKPAPDVTQGFAIFKASQSITFDPLPDKALSDPPFDLAATASSGLTVTFTTISPACSVSGNTVTLQTGGECVITAHQDGNNNYYGAPDVSRSFNIGKNNQAITWTEPLPERTYGDPNFYVLSATASSGLGVAFASNSTACRVGFVNGVGYAYVITGAGACEITASQAGNASYYAAPDVIRSFNVAKANQTITFNPLPNRTYGDPDFVLTASASSGLQVNYIVSIMGICNGHYDPAVGFLLTILHAGTCWVRATQPGDANYNPAPEVLTNFNIAKASQTITFAPIPNWDPNVHWMDLSATASSNLPVSYSVWKKSSNWPDACQITNGNYLVNKTITTRYGGVCNVDAAQAGNQDYLPATTIRHSFFIKNVIWLTISLHNKPADQTPYNAILQYLADTVYEMSNGTQYLGTVTIYQNYQNSSYVDILWNSSDWPHSPLSDYGSTGYQDSIGMGDVFQGCGFDFLANPQAGGYTLAHELGHYVYGLLDEYAADYGTSSPYQPHADDLPVYHSIMNDDWKALTGDYGWLNFSVPKYETWRNAQARIYSASGWGTLSRPPWEDPWSTRPYRILFPELTFFPLPTYQEASLELPTTPITVTRRYLNINWIDPTTVLQAAPDDGLAFSASVRSIQGSTLSYPEPVILMATAGKDQLIARAGLTVTLTSPNGSVSNLVLKDDGLAPDWMADDGQYIGYMPYDQNGVYTVTVNFDNLANTAWFTEIGSFHALGPNGETWTPTTQPVGEAFTVSASTQITITNWSEDDHGNTPDLATEMQPDNFSLPGRIDHPGDVDVFKVTPVVTGTLVVRVNGYALGLRPHIRLLAADKETVLKEINFQPNGNDYFFFRLEVTAGKPIYVEVWDQDSNAYGGTYRVSAGDPLASNQEQAPTMKYLPIIKR